MHAGVSIAAWDRDGRERLLRYGARPPFSLARISLLPDGRVAYRTKYPGPNGHTHRVMTPVDFLARIGALIPPPKYPLVRYHGVLAPNAKVRSIVVPPREKRVTVASLAELKPTEQAAPGACDPRRAANDDIGIAARDRLPAVAAETAQAAGMAGKERQVRTAPLQLASRMNAPPRDPGLRRAA